MHVSDCSCVLLTVLIISGLLCIWYQMGEANQQDRFKIRVFLRR